MIRYSSDSGIAYGWIVIMIFLIMMGIAIPYYYVIVNNMIAGPEGDNTIGINADILAGKQSEQSKGAIQFNIDFMTNVPIMIVLSILVYAVGRSIVVKKVP